MKLVFATGNKGKLREAREILGPGFEVLSSAQAGVTDDVEETGTSFQENSLLKATFFHNAAGLPCFADDSGLEVDALGGAPGIYSARYAGEDKDFSRNIDKLLSELDRVEKEAAAAGLPAPERTARFHCCVTLMLDGTPHFFDGTLEGTITHRRHGDGGFGYDPVFRPLGAALTLSEISEDAKNAISHRGAALRAMAQWLSEMR